MDDLTDPLADLKAEIQSENEAADQAAADAAKAAKPAAAEDASSDEGADATSGEDETDKDADSEATDETDDAKSEDKEDKSDDKADKPRRKRPEVMVPVARANEEAAKRRIAERDLAHAQAEISRLKGDDKTVDKTPTVEEIRVEERRRARLEIQLENFVNSGYEEYGRKEFDSVSEIIAQISGDAASSLIPIALEACTSPAQAARAIWALGQMEADDIENIVKLSPLRLAAKLSQLSTARIKKSGEADEDERKLAKTVKKSAEAPAPVNPVRGSNTPTDEFSDDLSEEQFTNLFNKRILKSPDGTRGMH